MASEPQRSTSECPSPFGLNSVFPLCTVLVPPGPAQIVCDGSRCRRRSNRVSGVFLRPGLIQDVGIPGPGTSGLPWSLRTIVLSKAHLMSTFHFLVVPHVMGPTEEKVVLALVEASSGLQNQSTPWLMVSVTPDSSYSILKHLYF